MKLRAVIGVVCLVLGILASNPPRAEASGSVEIHGFGSAAALDSSSPLYLTDYVTTGETLSFANLSRLGVNLHAKLDEQWSVATQFLAEGSNNNFTTNLEWGFVSYSPSPYLSVRAGRVILPVWQYSPQIDVGYSYLWIRPPSEVYNLNPLKWLNGVSLLSKIPAGPGVLQAELVGGDTSQDVTIRQSPDQTSTINARFDNYLGVDLSYDWDEHVVVRSGYFQYLAKASVTSPFSVQTPPPPLGFGFPVQDTAVNTLDVGFGRFISAGTKIDFEPLIFTSEFARRLTEGHSLYRTSAFYATLGYRIGKLTPHLTYAWEGDLQGDFRPRHPDLTMSTSLSAEHSWTGGLNFQAHDSVILKAEFSRASLEYDNTAANLDLNIYRVAADFVF